MVDVSELSGRLAVVHDSIPVDAREGFLSSIGDRSYSAELVSLTCSALGFPVSASTIKKFRRDREFREQVRGFTRSGPRHEGCGEEI